MEIIIHNNKENISWTELKDIYRLVGWNNHTEQKIKQIFEASTLVTVACKDSRIVGFGRALSDGVFNAAIYDVVVHPDFQGLGIGKRIMENLLYHLRDISCVHLISTTGRVEFYEGLGLRHVKTAMARYLNPQLTEEYLE